MTVMANLALEQDWIDGIYQLETTDPVVGGPDGIDNLQAKQLGARTNYLRRIGVPEWSADVEYQVNAIVQYDGLIFRAAEPTTDQRPDQHASIWKSVRVPTLAVGTSDDSAASTGFVHALLASRGMDGASIPLPDNSNLNNVTTSGQYYAIGASNRPPQSAGTAGWLLVTRHPMLATYVVQSYISSAASSQAVYVRRLANGVWDAWRELAFTDNLAMTGTPTAPTPATGDNSTRVSTTAFVNAAVQAAISDAMPSTIGSIVFEARTSARAGYLKLNGAVLKRADYPALWSYALSSGAIVADADWGQGWNGCFSHGDGSTTFRIPELRGEFIRCWDDARGVDGNRGVGTYQGFLNAWHAHGASSSAVGDHAHSAWTDTQGHHSHYVNDPGHVHVIGLGSVGVYGTAPGQGYGPHNGRANAVGSDGSGTGIWLNGDGSHGHNVGIGGAGAHAHDISIAGDGGGEARPRNIALLAMIRAY